MEKQGHTWPFPKWLTKIHKSGYGKYSVGHEILKMEVVVVEYAMEKWESKVLDDVLGIHFIKHLAKKWFTYRITPVAWGPLITP